MSLFIYISLDVTTAEMRMQILYFQCVTKLEAHYHAAYRGDCGSLSVIINKVALLSLDSAALNIQGDTYGSPIHC